MGHLLRCRSKHEKKSNNFLYLHKEDFHFQHRSLSFFFPLTRDVRRRKVMHIRRIHTSSFFPIKLTNNSIQLGKIRARAAGQSGSRFFSSASTEPHSKNQTHSEVGEEEKQPKKQNHNNNLDRHVYLRLVIVLHSSK